MAGFVIGLMVGGFIGVFIMALLKVSSRTDDETGQYFSENE